MSVKTLYVNLYDDGMLEVRRSPNVSDEEATAIVESLLVAIHKDEHEKIVRAAQAHERQKASRRERDKARREASERTP